MMKTIRFGTLATLLAVIAAPVAAQPDSDISVLTQNQYLGADLTPVVVADGPAAVNAAMIDALIAVTNNRFAERVVGLADSIADRRPHLVALQEVYDFACHDPDSTGACALFPGAFNDHLAATLAALGGEYRAAAVVENLSLAPPTLPFPGVPLVVDPSQPPIFIEVTDRDVILARQDVVTEPVDFGCAKPSADGCNYVSVAPIEIAGIPVSIERGFVGVDATINGAGYQFVNTHLDIKTPGGDPAAAILQSVQATELWLAVLGIADPARRLIVAGDFNSSPVDVSPVGVPTPYQQFVGGTLVNGTPLPVALTDVWTLRPGSPDGFTCCEVADLSNAPSQHDERVDIVFALPAPAKVRANVLDTEVIDKTATGLWPSDHASVSAELTY